MAKRTEIGTIIEVYNSSPLPYLPIKKIKELLDTAFRHRAKSENLPYSEYSLNVVYLGDDEIHEMNREYLDHDYPTDVITFTLESEGESLEGEVYIGAETARRQAAEYGVSLSHEIMRLAVHGALHLMGMDDATPQEKQKMTQEEDRYLKMYYGR